MSEIKTIHTLTRVCLSVLVIVLTAVVMAQASVFKPLRAKQQEGHDFLCMIHTFLVWMFNQK